MPFGGMMPVVEYIGREAFTERVFNDLVREAGVRVVFGERLDLKQGVHKDGVKIASIVMESGRTFAAQVFVDATYEGDLMAAAKVDYHVGREANSVYGEEWNGSQVGVLHHRHHFGAVKQPISP